MKIWTKDENESLVEEIEGEPVGGWLLIHKNGSKWSVTHIMSGRDVNGPEGLFSRYEQAKTYAEELTNGAVEWFFMNKIEMYEKNNRDLLGAIRIAARMKAESQ